MTTTPHFDVLIVGAGISGIDAAYRLGERCPDRTYTILEARDAIGGTWDLFRYPGIRSDSDMFTLGYPFRPWRDPKGIADGPSILAYVRETAAEYGIDRKIRFGMAVRRASFSSADARWTVEAVDTRSGELRRFSCEFLYVCAGYYDYEEGYTPEFAGTDRFRGRIVHPQKWSPDVDYAGKRVVVIGSGATAVTLVPTLAKTAARVTMLQRSPTYIVSLPARDRVADFLSEKLPDGARHAVVRWKSVVLGALFFQYCRRYPERAKRRLVGEVRRALGDGFDVKTHFTPQYAPWDQRVCLVPDGDLFEAIRSGKAEVVTDHIETFTERGLRLRSGTELEADIVVTATGLKLRFLGGIEVVVDGERVEPSKTMAYKGMMLSGVPNLAIAIGYTNASWTLKCDLTSEFVCRLLNHMKRHGKTTCCPRRKDPSVTEEPIIDFSSGYIRRSIDTFPSQGSKRPWRVHQNYALDLLAFRHAPIEDGALEFSRAERPVASAL
jgi:cation diffusion facilitator CzcD-associated flavoprotein CzcO